MALNITLRNLTKGCIPNKREKIDLEKTAIQLTLTAGANPNSIFYGEPIFDSFIKSGKIYGALEVAKMPDFSSCRDLDKDYD